MYCASYWQMYEWIKKNFRQCTSYHYENSDLENVDSCLDSGSGHDCDNKDDSSNTASLEWINVF